MTKRYAPGPRILLPHQTWPHVGSRWPAYNVESDQARGLYMWWSALRDPGSHYQCDVIQGVSFSESGTPTWATDSEMGAALQLASGSGEYIEATQSGLPNRPCTFTAWCRLDNPQTWTTYNAASYADPDVGFSRGIALRITVLGGITSQRFIYRFNANEVTTDLTVPAEGLVHIAGVSYSATDHRLFCAGIQRNTNNANDSWAGCDTISIGTNNIDNAYSDHWNGEIFDVRIYNRALPPAEIWQLYAYETRWELHEIPRSVWAVRWAGAAGAEGNFTADAVIKIAQSGSLTADAIIKEVAQTGTLTNDATIKVAKTGTLNADATIEAAQTGTLNADAVIQAAQTGSATLDAVILRARTGTFTGDSAIQAAQSGSTTADATIQAAQTGVVACDAAILAAQTGSAIFDAAILAAQTGTVNADAVILTAKTGAATLDAVIGAVGTGAITCDAVIIGGEGTFTADAIILSAQSGTLTINSVIQTTGTSNTLTLDAHVYAAIKSKAAVVRTTPALVPSIGRAMKI